MKPTPKAIGLGGPPPMPNYLTPEEQARLDEIEAALAKLEPLKAERAAILNRQRQRKHYANKRA